MADSLYSADIVARPIPWRRATNLHKALGARVLTWSQLQLTANTPFQLFEGEYDAQSIDRIVGAFIGCIGIPAGAGWTLFEQTTGFIFNGGAGNYQFNVITPVNYANLTITSTANITAANNLFVGLFNIEVPGGFWQ